ncbi:hypothetical protein M8818_004790 [Zalaria obscura]|uniref:Uncharacterized protein n=1 Tax=Zalaria obscura TaxID=2024903 RepID=A0ACC3SAZ1_9PEZI
MQPKVPRGERLAPALVDEYAETRADDIYACIPHDPQDLSQGFQDITWRMFSNAINKAAFWLEEQLGKSNGSFEAFIYIGPRDLRYAILVLAAAKVGRVPLLLSLLSSLEGKVKLAKVTGSEYILHGDGFGPLASTIQENLSSVSLITTPGLRQWLGGDPCKSYAWTKTYDEAKDDPLFIAHSSGTTGQSYVYVCAWGWTNTDYDYQVYQSQSSGLTACSATWMQRMIFQT